MRVAEEPLIDVAKLCRRYGPATVLDDVSIRVEAGTVHALLGRNGAGKTTLLRVLAGLVAPSAGEARVGGIDVSGSPRRLLELIGLVPSGDRTFYLRISGLENLVFFARLRGYRRRHALVEAQRALDRVGLGEASRRPVGTYSHGMQKRLSVARALLHDPAVLLVDEATHDLDPEGARDVRRLVRDAAVDRGAAVLWTTQRVEEIRGLADRLTLLDRGRVRFEGTVGALLERVPASRFVVGVRNGDPGGGHSLDGDLMTRLRKVASVSPVPGADEVVLTLASGATLGDALQALHEAGLTVLSCRQEVPEVEDAVMRLLTGEHP